MPRIAAAALVAAALTLTMAPARSADTATPDDTARFLAGLPPAADSPLTPLTKSAAWQEHARYFNSIFGREEAKLAKVRAFSQAHLTDKHDTMLYMFSGPDFLYATSFFPTASTYVMAGLEPAGDIPQLTNYKLPVIDGTLHNLEASLRTLLSISFFITKNMDSQLRSGPIYGTLPVLYVFLARTGKTVHEVSLVNLDEQGNVQAASESAGRRSGQGTAKGVKIVFSDGDRPNQTLYYFSTNLADGGVSKSGFLAFCDKLGVADSFIKSASYLLHGGGFGKVRSFLLDHSATILEDDSGIPVAYFDPKKWRLQPFGRYVGPISIFAGDYQPRMAQLFRKGDAIPLEFGLGYRWRQNETSLLLAQKLPASTTENGLTPPLPTDQYGHGTEAQSPNNAKAEVRSSRVHRRHAQRVSNRAFRCRTSGVFPFCSNTRTDSGRR